MRSRAVLSCVIAKNSFDYRLDVLGWNEVVATLDDHGENFCDFFLLMRVQVPEHEWVKLQEQEIVATDQT